MFNWKTFTKMIFVRDHICIARGELNILFREFLILFSCLVQIFGSKHLTVILRRAIMQNKTWAAMRGDSVTPLILIIIMPFFRIIF